MQTKIHVEAKRFPHLGDIKGIPVNTLQSHQQNYLRSVTQTNGLFDRLVTMTEDTGSPTLGNLRTTMSELPVALATVKSYELFLTHLGGSVRTPQTNLAQQIRKDFGSQEAFLRHFKTAALASPGWVALAYDLDLRRLLCLIGDTPEKLSVWNLAPVMLLEVSSRSVGVDFAQDRERYIQTIMEQIDWSVVERNLEDAGALQPAGKPY
jgi:Fe-Mn family superoxide dismutase